MMDTMSTDKTTPLMTQKELSYEIGAMLGPGQYIALELVHDSPVGHVYSLSIQDGDCPGSNLIIVTDTELYERLKREETLYNRNFITNPRLLALLRSVKGQYLHIYGDYKTPIFYYEYCGFPKGSPNQEIWERFFNKVGQQE